MITSQELNNAAAGLPEDGRPIISSSSPSTPTRATFPYKPASVTPKGQRNVFRPLVPSLTPLQAKSQKKHLLQRCKTFPIDTSTTTKATEKIIEAPSWLSDNFTQNEKSCYYFEDVLTFPVSISTQSPCWWLDDMTNWEPIKEHPHITVKAFLTEMRRETIEAGVSSSSTHSLVDDDERTNELAEALRDLLELDRMPDMLPLWRQIIELRRYIERAYHLHEDRREKMQVILKNIESVVNNATGNGRSHEVVHNESNEEIQAASSMEDLTRKTTVGLTGGTLVTAGLVLIPAPVIPGILVVYGGLLVLASEFDSAKTAVEAMQGPMKQLLRDEEDPNKGIYDCFHNILWEELIEYSSTVKELDEDFMVIMKLKPWKDDDGAQNGGKDVEIERIKREKKNAMKRYARQILLLEDKDTDDAQKKHGEDLANSDSNDRVDECDNVT
jgi:hypothetical protein